MSKELERQYYLIYPRLVPGVVLLQPTEATETRADLSGPLPPGKPLEFVNDEQDEPGAKGIKERLGDVLFDPQSFALKNHLREQIEEFEISGLQFYPMVYRDLSGVRHKDYWYANLFIEQPFLDLKRSELMDDDEPDPESIYVLKYAFNEKVMRGVPEEARLIFALSGVMNPGIFVHQRILGILRDSKATGYEAFRVSEFEDGMELQEQDQAEDS